MVLRHRSEPVYGPAMNRDGTARPPTSTTVARRAVRVGLWSAVAALVWALLITVTGWSVFGFLGPVSIVVCAVAFLVAALAALPRLGARLGARHRAARRDAYGPRL